MVRSALDLTGSFDCSVENRAYGAWQKQGDQFRGGHSNIPDVLFSTVPPGHSMLPSTEQALNKYLFNDVGISDVQIRVFRWVLCRLYGESMEIHIPGSAAGDLDPIGFL